MTPFPPLFSWEESFTRRPLVGVGIRAVQVASNSKERARTRSRHLFGSVTFGNHSEPKGRRGSTPLSVTEERPMLMVAGPDPRWLP